MDPSDDHQDCGATAPIAHPRERPHGGPFAPQAPFHPPRKSQEDRPQAPPPRRAVRPHPQPASALLPAGESGDQRGRQKERLLRNINPHLAFSISLLTKPKKDPLYARPRKQWRLARGEEGGKAVNK